MQQHSALVEVCLSQTSAASAPRLDCIGTGCSPHRLLVGQRTYSSWYTVLHRRNDDRGQFDTRMRYRSTAVNHARLSRRNPDISPSDIFPPDIFPARTICPLSTWCKTFPYHHHHAPIYIKRSTVYVIVYKIDSG